VVNSVKFVVESMLCSIDTHTWMNIIGRHRQMGN